VSAGLFLSPDWSREDAAEVRAELDGKRVLRERDGLRVMWDMDRVYARLSRR
jgi:hypothetical protein